MRSHTRKGRSRIVLVAAALAAGALAAGGGAALAGVARSAPTSVITACWRAQNAAVRIIDPEVETCRGGETELSWNREGPAGAPGPEGPAGPSPVASYGSPGTRNLPPPCVSGVDPGVCSNAYQRVAGSLALDAVDAHVVLGKLRITWTTNVITNPQAAAAVRCQLVSLPTGAFVDEVAYVDVADANGASSTPEMLAEYASLAAVLPVGATGAAVDCRTEGGTGWSTGVVRAQLFAFGA
jgi:hypothetical protein